jgi:hypothetical protein
MERQPHTFDKDQPSESPGRRSQVDPAAPAPSFDEGEPRPSPIERSGDRRAPDATTPPGERRDPKRNTM